MLNNKEKFDEVMLKRTGVFRDIKALFAKTNVEAQFSRNSPCNCGSGKKGKRCCIAKHQKEALKVEELTLIYRELTLQAINLKRKLEFVKSSK